MTTTKYMNMNINKKRQKETRRGKYNARGNTYQGKRSGMIENTFPKGKMELRQLGIEPRTFR